MIERMDAGDRKRVSKATWRFNSGKATFWNVNPEDVALPIIEHEPPVLTELSDAIITPRQIDPKIEGPRRGSKRFATGGVYDRDLKLIPVFLEREAFEASEKATNLLKNDAVLSRERLDDVQELRGRYVYQGILRGHFGHFLLESVSRMWYMLKADPDIKILVHGNEVSGGLPSYIMHIFKLLDIDLDRIVTATRTMRVEHLFFPQSEFEIRWKAHSSYADLFRELYERNARLIPDKPTPKRVYLTRRQLRLKTARDRRKAVTNEEEVEKLFATRGFEIVAPEKIPFPEQIALAGGANQIAGLKGSALHMSLFSQRPAARLILLGRSQTMNQSLIDGLKDMQSHQIMCESPKTDDGSVVDIDMIRAALKEM